MEIPPRLLGQSARAVRSLWIAETRMFLERITGQPSKYRPGPRFDGASRWDDPAESRGRPDKPTTWHKAAEFIITHALPLIDWVHFVAHGAGREPKLTRRPQPNWLHSEKPLERFRAYQQDRGVNLNAVAMCHLQHQQLTLNLEARRLQEDVATCGEELTAREAMVAVIEGESYQLRPLFRYCMAHRLGLTELEEQLEGAALLEFLHSPRAYQAAWGEVVPRGLVEQADSIGGSTA